MCWTYRLPLSGQPIVVNCPCLLATPYLLPIQQGKPYTKSGLFSMWERARERAGIKESVWFKDLRALGATGAAKVGEKISEIQTRLAHTSSKTSEIYIKESVPEWSTINLSLPWSI
jgi:integrase